MPQTTTTTEGRSECLLCHTLLNKVTRQCKCAVRTSATVYVSPSSVCINCEDRRCLDSEMQQLYGLETDLNAHLCEACKQTGLGFFEKRKLKNKLLLQKKQIEQDLNKIFSDHAKKQELQEYFELRRQIEQMPEYNKWRDAVLTKNDRICSVCGSNNAIEVDHRYYSFYSIVRRNNLKTVIDAYECKELWDINNGAPLCKQCHDQTTSSQNYRKLNQ